MSESSYDRTPKNHYEEGPDTFIENKTSKFVTFYIDLDTVGNVTKINLEVQTPTRKSLPQSTFTGYCAV